MQVYLDAGKLRPFDPSAGECYDLGFGPVRADILDRIAKGVWVRGVLTGTRVRKPVPLPEGYEDDPHLALLTNQGQDLSEPPWGLFYYTRISLAEAYESFDSLGLPIPRSLREDIQDQGQPEAPPASVSDPVGRTAKSTAPLEGGRAARQGQAAWGQREGRRAHPDPRSNPVVHSRIKPHQVPGSDDQENGKGQRPLQTYLQIDRQAHSR